MKKLRLLILLLLAMPGGTAFAQLYTQTTITQNSCNNDGIAATNITSINYTTPVTLVYYTYVGNTPDTIAIHSNVTTFPDVVTGLPSGYYYIGGSDANGFTFDSSNFYMPSTFQLTPSSTLANCPTPGTATVAISGSGTAPYAYSWVSSQGTSYGTNSTMTGPAGQYTISVTDNAGCTGVAHAYIEDNFYITANITTTQANCTNGSATVASATGGTAPYTYLWSNGANTSSITNLVQGAYNVVITDANGCHSTSYASIQQAIYIGVNTTVTPATCLQNNGGIISFGSGGTSPYTYQYSTGFNGQTLTGIHSGSYSVTATDANGCTGTGYAYVNASTPITVTNSVTPTACTTPTGGAVLTINGGLSPYTTHWSTYPGQTGNTLSNVADGYYSFNIKDGNGCIQSGTVYVPPVHILQANIATTSAYCTQANGTATVTSITGGTTPYAYLWGNGNTTTGITGLASGDYGVTITDAAGCHKAFSGIVYSYSPVSLGLAPTPASCIFNADGAITSYASGGTAPYTYSVGSGTGVVTGLHYGDHYVSVSDANGCTAQSYTYVDYDHSNNSCYCTISGMVYDDANGNCVQDAGEAGIEHIGINCSGIGVAYTDANGNYSFKVPTGSYTLSENVLAYYPLAPCQNNSIAITTVAASGCTQTADFANVINPIHDISIATWNWTGPIPGFNYHQKTVISNDGTVTESAVVAGYNTDGQLNAATFSPTGLFSGTGNQYNSNTISLNPGDQQIVYADYTVPTNIPLNTAVVFKDSAAYTSPMGNWLNDYSPWNNVCYFTAYTIGSYDPNSIQVSPQGTSAAGNIPSKDSILTYMVHFQNTGTYFAQNIVVKTKLDANLDWTTLRPQYSSFPATIAMDENGMLTYTFSNIDLPAESTSEDGSNGMFTFTIHIRHNLPAGTTFSNKANIYFDFNAPVATDSTMNTLLDPTAIGNVVLNKATFSVFPNPTSGNFTASITATTNGAAQLKVMDLSGRILKSQSLNLTAGTQTVPVAMGSVASGLYFVTLTQGGITTTQKLTIGK